MNVVPGSCTVGCSPQALAALRLSPERSRHPGQLAGRRQAHTVLGGRALREHRLLQGAPGWTWELGGLPITAFFSPSLDIVRNKVVHFDLLHEDVSLQYFIPALS